MYSEYLKDTKIWRAFFIFGGVATYASYYFRKQNLLHLRNLFAPQESQSSLIERISIYKPFVLGAVTTGSWFVPMVYSNFYVTKILGRSSGFGLSVTFLSLMSYIIFTPLIGYISDRMNLIKEMSKTFVTAVLFAVKGFIFLHQGWWFGQVSLILAASLAGANIHVVMNQIFPLGKRSQSVNLYFTIGASMGGLVPALSGYLSMHYNFVYTSLWAVNVLLVMSAYLFAKPLCARKVSAATIETV